MKRLVTGFCLLLVLGIWAFGAEHRSDNFIVYYNTAETTANYAKAIADNFETAWKVVFDDLGYAKSDWMDEYYMQIYIKALKPHVLGLTKWSKGDFNSYFEINLERWINNRDLLKATCGHEFFHSVQIEYSWDESIWLLDTTAVWIEDKIYKPTGAAKKQYGFLFYMDNWNVYTDVNITSNIYYMRYAASIFIQYLTERNPGKNNLVKTIWENTRAMGENSFEALALALGDDEAWGEKSRKFIGEFSVMNLIRSPTFNATYSLADLKDHDTIKSYPRYGRAPLFKSPLRFTNGIFQPGYVKPYLRSEKRSKVVMSPDYVEILPPSVEGRPSGDLLLAVRGEVSSRWIFHLVQIPSSGQWKVFPFPSVAAGKWSFLRTKNFPDSGRIFLTAIDARTENKTGSYDLSAVFAAPPMVDSFEVGKSDSNGIQEQFWWIKRTSKPQGGRETFLYTDAGLPFWPDEQMYVNVIFNHTLGKIPKLTLGEVEVHLKQIPGYPPLTAFQAVFPLNTISSFMNKPGNEALIPVLIEGKDILGVGFDEKPETFPDLKSSDGSLELVGWEGDLENVPGGADRLSGRSFPIVATAPHLSEVKVYQFPLRSSRSGSPPLIYKAGWDKVAGQTVVRNFKKEKDEKYQPLKTAQIELRFDRPVENIKVSFEGVPIPVSRNLSKEDQRKKEIMGTANEPPELLQGRVGAIYTGRIPIEERLINAFRDKREARLNIQARTPSGINLDANPKTRGYYGNTFEKWKAYESVKDGVSGSSGGPDTWHKLKGEDISDDWIETDLISGERHNVRIVWLGEKDLTATVEVGGRLFTFTGKQVTPLLIHLECILDAATELDFWPLENPPRAQLRELYNNIVEYEGPKKVGFSLLYEIGGNKDSPLYWKGTFKAGNEYRYDASKGIESKHHMTGSLRQVEWRRAQPKTTPEPPESKAEKEPAALQIWKETDFQSKESQDFEMEWYEEEVIARLKIKGRIFQFQGKYEPSTDPKKPTAVVLRHVFESDDELNNWPLDKPSLSELRERQKLWKDLNVMSFTSYDKIAFALVYQLTGYLQRGNLSGSRFVYELRFDKEGNIIESYPWAAIEAMKNVVWARQKK